MKKKKLNMAQFMVYFIAFIMISSVFGVIFYGYREQSTVLEYGGIKFTRENNGWSADINNKKLVFDYYPEEVEHINLSSEIGDLLKNKLEIDVTSDTNDTFKDTIALVEYSMSELLNNFNIYVRTGFTANNEFDLSVIKCSDATAFVPVIYFKESDKTLISLEDDCIIAEARNDPDFVRIKDRILYGILGIME